MLSSSHAVREAGAMVEPRRRDGIARRMRRGPEGVKDVRVVAGGASLRDSERWTRVGFGAPDACARTVAAPAPDVDRRPLDEPSQIGHLRSFVRSIALAAWVFGGAETTLAVASGRPTALVAGGSIVAFGIYLLWFRRRLARRTAAASAHELAGATMVVIVGSGLLQPLHGESLALAALIPVAIALPFVERTAMRRLIVLGWGVGIAGIVGAEAFPNLSGLPPVAITPLRIGAVAIILGLVLLLIEQVWRRLSDAAGELASLAGMSSELTRTLDPLAMGDVIARRIAEAVAADEAGLCYWDRIATRCSPTATTPRPTATMSRPSTSAPSTPRLGRCWRRPGRPSSAQTIRRRTRPSCAISRRSDSARSRCCRSSRRAVPSAYWSCPPATRTTSRRAGCASRSASPPRRPWPSRTRSCTPSCASSPTTTR
jgi:nitrate reductase gamma subunit